MRTILILIAVTAVAGGCGVGGGPEPDVVASFYPLAYTAQQVGGPGLRVEDLTPPGVEPHDLEVTPNDVRRIRDAKLVLVLGRGFQPQVEDAATGDAVVRVLDTPGLRVFPDGDPHVWLDPLRYAVVVRRVGRALDRQGRAEALVARLRALDRRYARGLRRCERRELVTSHAAFAYLAARYGLRQVAVTGLSPEAEPSPSRLQHAVDEVRAHRATTVFVEPLVSRRIAETVAREAGVRVAVLDPIEGLTPAEEARGVDYFDVMRANLRTLRTALACR